MFHQEPSQVIFRDCVGTVELQRALVGMACFVPPLNFLQDHPCADHQTCVLWIFLDDLGEHVDRLLGFLPRYIEICQQNSAVGAGRRQAKSSLQSGNRLGTLVLQQVNLGQVVVQQGILGAVLNVFLQKVNSCVDLLLRYVAHQDFLKKRLGQI